MDIPNAAIAHVGVAVSDLANALRFYRDVLGLSPGEPDQRDGATVVSVACGDVDVELLQPVTTDSPIAKFLAKRGPGIHHLCLRVPDLDRALDVCRERGYRLVDEQPRAGHEGRRIAFVRPKSTGGILLELTE